MAFSDEFLTELKYRVDIEALVSEYVQLKRAGSRLVGLCPFHSEKTPSFTVFTDDPHYHCFGCGAGGDVITFVRGVEGLDYVDAVKLLAQRVGLDVPEDGQGDPQARQRREELHAMNREAALFFHECLQASEGSAALSYLRGRGLSMGVIKRFGLGWAPDSWDALTNHLRQKGYADKQLQDCRLAGLSKKGTSYDYFRGRVIFPIIDVRKNVIAFGGRVLDDGLPKYLNSPDTPVFKKSHNLYALNIAKNHASERLVLAEGYMDVIALHAAGFENAVATLGTALTKEQARLVRRYASEVVIAYDSDRAGQAATQRAIGLLTDAGVEVKVLTMEGAKDPDEFIKKFGAPRFAALLSGSGGHVEYKLEAALGGFDLQNPDERVKYLRRAVDILAALGSPIQADVYAGRLAQKLEVGKDAIIQEVARARKKRAGEAKREAVKRQTAAIASQTGRRASAIPRGMRTTRAEQGVLLMLFHNPDFYEYISSELDATDFTVELNRRVYEAMCGIIKRGGALDTVVLGQDLTVSEMGSVAAMLQDSVKYGNTRRELEDFIAVIKDARQRSQLAAALESGEADVQDVINMRRKKLT